jgi:hypothetical protein
MVLSGEAPGDPRNALFLAQACALAYLDEPDAQPRFADQLGLKAKLISVDNIQAYVGESNGAVVIAFRGSQAPTTLDGLKDWLLTDADDHLIVPEGREGTDFAAAGVEARFHRGFMEALHKIWEPLLAAVTEAVEAGDRPLWITGHSMGGSLALLAAWRLQRNFITVHEIVTFGAPMTGNLATAQAFEQEFAGKIFRYVNLEDPVPLLPSISLDLAFNTYAHCQTEVSLAAVQALASATSSIMHQIVEATHIDHLWNAVVSRLSAHFIEYYEDRIQEKCKHYQERIQEKCKEEEPSQLASASQVQEI